MSRAPDGIRGDHGAGAGAGAGVGAGVGSWGPSGAAGEIGRAHV